MSLVVLRSAFSEIAEKNNFPLVTLIVVAIVVAVIVLLLSIFRGKVNEFLRISDAELYVDKNAKPTAGTTKSKTQSLNKGEVEVDPEKTVNMRTVDLPKKTTRKGAK